MSLCAATVSLDAAGGANCSEEEPWASPAALLMWLLTLSESRSLGGPKDVLRRRLPALSPIKAGVAVMSRRPFSYLCGGAGEATKNQGKGKGRQRKTTARASETITKYGVLASSTK